MLEKNSFLLEGEVYTRNRIKRKRRTYRIITVFWRITSYCTNKKSKYYRITPPEKRTKEIIVDRELITFDYQEAKDMGKNINLFDGKIEFTFFPILDMELNQVTVLGHVTEPGIYSLRHIMI